MKFFLSINPPRTTHQQKGVNVVNGKPIFYDKPKVKAAREELTWALLSHKPNKPIEGAIRLKTVWLFKSKSHKKNEFKTTRPDTDNMIKLLKDCMTDVGFWLDDAQVADEETVKMWTNEKAGISVYVEKIKEDKL